MPRRICPECQKEVKGRSDKKYCSTACRGKHNYKLRGGESDAVKTIDRILHRNHAVMCILFNDEKRKHFKIQKILMSKMGFDFSYHTGIYLNSKGKTYHYIYDFAWMEFSAQEIMVVQGRGKATDWKPRA